MKVTLDKNEIQEAVQHYISHVLGSSLLVSEIAVIQGRESNGARIEVDLFKAEPIDLDNGDILISCDAVEEPIVNPEPVKNIKEVQPETEKPNDKPVAKKSTSVAALNLPVDEDDEEDALVTPEPAIVKEDHDIPSEPKSASVASTATAGMKPLPGSFFGNN